MSSKGWVPVHRQLQDHWLWEDKPYARGQAWIDLLLLANHRDEKFYSNKNKNLVNGKRGCVYKSINELSERWGWSRKKTTGFLGILEEEHMVTVNSTRKGTTITIENYSVYNDVGATDCTSEEQLRNKRGTSEEQLRNKRGTYTTINNNIEQLKTIKNNDNNIKESLPALVPEEWVESLENWLDMRASKGVFTSQPILKTAINRLAHLSKGDIDRGLKIINNSVINGWKDFYDLKEDKKSKPFDVMDIVIEEDEQ